MVLKFFANFYKVYYVAAVVMVLFFTSYTYSSADIIRFEQPIKNALTTIGLSFTQPLRCSDLSGNIEEVTLSLVSELNSNRAYTLQFIKPSETRLSPSAVLRTSNIALTGDVGVQEDITFTFPNPLDVDGDLCAGTDRVFMTARAVDFTTTSYTRLGKSDSDVYPNEQLESYGGDAYFIINGKANINTPPVLNLVGNLVVNFGDTLIKLFSSYDQDEFKDRTYNISGLPSNALLAGNRLQWTPNQSQVGVYEVEVRATDSGNGISIPPQSDFENITVTVNDANLDIIRFEQPIKNALTTIGLSFTQPLRCSDLSGNIEEVTLSLVSELNSNRAYTLQFIKPSETRLSPSAVLRTSNIALTGDVGVQEDITFTFPNPLDVDGDLCAGTDRVFMTARAVDFTTTSYTRLGKSDSDVYPNEQLESYGGDAYFIINPNAYSNSAPVIDIINDQNINESETLNFKTTATDVDDDQLTYTVTGLPEGAVYDSVTGDFFWTPGYHQAGQYEVTFTVSDGQLSNTVTIIISVQNVNRAPELGLVGNKLVAENQTLQFVLEAFDPDGDTLVFTANNLPQGAILQGNTFSWVPNFNQAGNYGNIEIIVTDSATPMELDMEIISISVGDVNRAPEIFNPGTQMALVGEQIEFTITSSDPDNDILNLNAINLPSGSSFNDVTGEFSWIPSLIQEGTYIVTFVVSDAGFPSESTSVDVMISVGNDSTTIEQTEELILLIVNFGLPNNITNSYMANLQKVAPFIENGQIEPAINQLQSFINKVNQDYTKNKIDLSQRNQLINVAQGIIDQVTG